MDNILNVINKELGINIFRNTRKREYVDGRALFYFIVRKNYKVTLKEIGKFAGQYKYPVHHATIVHALKNWETILQWNPQFDKILNELLDEKTYYRQEDARYISNHLHLLNERELKILKNYLHRYDSRVKRKHNTTVQRVEEKSKERTLQSIH